MNSLFFPDFWVGLKTDTGQFWKCVFVKQKTVSSSFPVASIIGTTLFIINFGI